MVADYQLEKVHNKSLTREQSMLQSLLQRTTASFMYQYQ